MTPRVALTIAGSDSGGGAGIQADLKVFGALGVYGTSVLTAITAQDTRGVHDVYPLPGTVVGAQLDAVLGDMAVRATKTGMLGTAEVAAAVAARARAGLLPNLVVDPVITSTSGHRLGAARVAEQLLPYAVVATPNVAEASALVGWRVTTPADMARAAAQLASNGPKSVVVTGGDLVTGEPAVTAASAVAAAAGESGTAGTALTGESIDAVWTDGGEWFLRGPRIVTRNTHGSGCTFSAAITARLALGDAVPAALVFAKEYVARSLAGAHDWQLGGGRGPLDHFGWSSGRST